jgi:hypothetical protein
MIDDSHLLAASEDRTWTIWDMNTEKLSKIYRAAMGAVRGVAMGPDQVSKRDRGWSNHAMWCNKDCCSSAHMRHALTVTALQCVNIACHNAALCALRDF